MIELWTSGGQIHRRAVDMSSLETVINDELPKDGKYFRARILNENTAYGLTLDDSNQWKVHTEKPRWHGHIVIDRKPLGDGRCYVLTDRFGDICLYIDHGFYDVLFINFMNTLSIKDNLSLSSGVFERFSGGPLTHSFRPTKPSRGDILSISHNTSGIWCIERDEKGFMLGFESETDMMRTALMI